MVETVYSASSWMKCCLGCYEVSCHPIIQKRWAVAGHKCATRSVVWRYRAAPLTPVVYLTVCLGTGKINKIWENSRNFFPRFSFGPKKYALSVFPTNGPWAPGRRCPPWAVAQEYTGGADVMVFFFILISNSWASSSSHCTTSER